MKNLQISSLVILSLYVLFFFYVILDGDDMSDIDQLIKDTQDLADTVSDMRRSEYKPGPLEKQRLFGEDLFENTPVPEDLSKESSISTSGDNKANTSGDSKLSTSGDGKAGTLKDNEPNINTSKVTADQSYYVEVMQGNSKAIYGTANDTTNNIVPGVEAAAEILAKGMTNIGYGIGIGLGIGLSVIGISMVISMSMYTASILPV